MRSHFSSYTTKIDNWLFHCGVDLTLKSKAPISGLEWRAHIRIDLNRPTTDGLATQDEESELYDVETTILNALADFEQSFVSLVTHQQRRTMVIYLDRELKSDHAVFSQVSTHKVQLIDCIHDPDWSEYKEVLYPTPEIEKKLLFDNPRLKALAESGDDCAQLHHIKMTYLAADPQSAETLAASLKKDGFSVTAVTKATGTAAGKWRIACDTRLPLAEATIDGFRQIAEKTGTTFEDWSSEIIAVESEGRAKKKRKGKKKAATKKAVRAVGRRAVKRVAVHRAPAKKAGAKKKAAKKTAVGRRKAARRGPRRG